MGEKETKAKKDWEASVRPFVDASEADLLLLRFAAQSSCHEFGRHKFVFFDPKSSLIEKMVVGKFV